MRAHISINHLSRREQKSLTQIKKIILSRLSPIYIYYFGSDGSEYTIRSCFRFKRKNAEWEFGCDLLIVLPDDIQIGEEMIYELEKATIQYADVNMLIFSQSYFTQRLNNGNFFFRWIQRSAVLLFENKELATLLPAPLNKSECYKLYPNSYKVYIDNLRFANNFLEKAIESTNQKNYVDACSILIDYFNTIVKAISAVALGYEESVCSIYHLIQMLLRHSNVDFPEKFISDYTYLSSPYSGNISIEKLEEQITNAWYLKSVAEIYFKNNPQMLPHISAVSVDAKKTEPTTIKNSDTINQSKTTQDMNRNEINYSRLHLSEEEIANPYKVVNDFFLQFGFDDLTIIVDSWMEALMNSKIWDWDVPGYLLIFYDEVIKLLEASYLIQARDNSKRVGILTNKDLTGKELMDPIYYCSDLLQDFQWDFFPRSLNQDKFINPYIVFDGFFEFMDLSEWTELLYYSLQIALTNEIWEPECKENTNVLQVKTNLQQLFEACHLIKVREFRRPTKVLAEEINAGNVE